MGEEGSWRDGSVMKSACCSHRRPTYVRVYTLLKIKINLEKGKLWVEWSEKRETIQKLITWNMKCKYCYRPNGKTIFCKALHNQIDLFFKNNTITRINTSFDLYLVIFLKCMHECFCLLMCLCTICIQCSGRPQESIWNSVKLEFQTFEPPCGSCKLNLGPLQE